MGHDITRRDSAAYAIRPAWHGIGRVVDHLMTPDEAPELSGLTWTVESFPVRVELPQPDPFTPAEWSDAKDYMGLRRSDTGALLHIATTSYAVVQSSQLFGIVRDLGLKVDAAFSMNEGRRVVVVARMDSAEDVQIIPGDTVRRHLMVSTSHDGSAAVNIVP